MQSSCMREAIKTPSSQLEEKPKSSKQDCLGLGLQFFGICKYSQLFSVWLVWVSCHCDCPKPTPAVFISLKKAYSWQSTIQCEVFGGFYNLNTVNYRPSPTPPTDRWDVKAQWYYKHLQEFFFLSLPFSYQCANLLFEYMSLYCGFGLLIPDLKMQYRLKAAEARTQMNYQKRVCTAKLTYLSKYHNRNKNYHIQVHVPAGLGSQRV